MTQTLPPTDEGVPRWLKIVFVGQAVIIVLLIGALLVVSLRNAG